MEILSIPVFFLSLCRLAACETLEVLLWLCTCDCVDCLVTSAGAFAFSAVCISVPVITTFIELVAKGIHLSLCDNFTWSWTDVQLMFNWLQGILIISILVIGLAISSDCWHRLCLSQPIRSSPLTFAIIFRQKVLGTLPANPYFGCWPNKALYDTTVIASFVRYWSAIRQNTSQHFTKAQVMQYYLLFALQFS